MNKQAALLLAVLAILIAGATLFLRSNGAAVDPALDGPTMAAPDGTPGRPAALAPVDAGVGQDERVVARVSPKTAPAATINLDVAHPWQGQLAGLTGRLVEPDGTPIGGLMVELIEVDGNMFSEARHHALGVDSLVVGEGRSGADGTFLIQGARGEGFHGLTVDAGGARSAVRLVEQTLAFGRVTDIGDVVLEEHGTAFGTVIDEDGEPVAGARVRLAPVPEIVVQTGILDVREGTMLAFGEEQVEVLNPRRKFLAAMDRLPAATATTDKDGSFRMEGVPMGMISGGVDCPGHVFSAVETFEMTGQEHDLGEVELLFGRTATGKVVDAAGEGLAGIEVRAGAMHPALQFGLLQKGVVTDESGSFEIGTIPEEGTVIGAARRWAGDPWTVAKATGSGDSVTIRLGTAAPLTVHLALEDGTPVSGARFKLEPIEERGAEFGLAADMAPLMERPAPRHASAEPAPGQYRIDGVALGKWHVEARVEGQPSAWAEVAHGTEDIPLEMTITGGWSLALKVIDSITREPISAAHGSVVVPSSALPIAVASGWSNDSGELQLGPFAVDVGVPRGTGWVRQGGPVLVVERPGYAQKHVSLFGHEKANEANRTFDVEMLPGGILAGRVTWGGGPPEDSYMITLEMNSSGFDEIYVPRLAFTDAEGHFRIEGLVAGTYSGSIMERFLGGNPLGLMKLDREPETFARDAVIVTAGEEAVWNLDLLPDGAVPKGWYEGRVLIDGLPPAGGGMVLITQDEERFEVPLDASGSFRSPDLDAQAVQRVKITIQGVDADGKPKEEEIFNSWRRVPAGAGDEIILEFRNTLLRVTVLNADTGGPVKDVAITVEHRANRSLASAGVTDEDGLLSVRVRLESEADAPLITANAEGYAEDRKILTESALSKGLTLRIRPTVECSGRVVAGISTLNEYLVITSAADEDDSVNEWCHIQEEGAFSTQELPPGSYQARLLPMNDEEKHVSFELGPNGDAGLVLDFTNL